MNTENGHRQETEETRAQTGPAAGMNPYQNSHNFIEGDTMRQLLSIRYLCPLCASLHITQQYLTVAANDLNQFQEKVTTAMNSDEMEVEMVLKNSELHHHNAGDYDELTQAMNGRPTAFGILEWQIEDESDYTCDDCQATFNSIGEHRDHCGTDPDRNRPTPKGKGIPVCMKEGQQADA